MWIGLGLIVLAVVFVVFGSKEEEASILYYDMEDDLDTSAAVDSEEIEDAPAASPRRTRSRAAEESSESVGAGRLADDRPAETSAEAADIAKSIYDDITL